MSLRALLDANVREIVLAHVLGSAPDSGECPTATSAATLAWAEIDTIRSIDVPLFINVRASRESAPTTA